MATWYETQLTVRSVDNTFEVLCVALEEGGRVIGRVNVPLDDLAETTAFAALEMGLPSSRATFRPAKSNAEVNLIVGLWREEEVVVPDALTHTGGLDSLTRSVDDTHEFLTGDPLTPRDGDDEDNDNDHLRVLASAPVAYAGTFWVTVLGVVGLAPAPKFRVKLAVKASGLQHVTPFKRPETISGRSHGTCLTVHKTYGFPIEWSFRETCVPMLRVALHQEEDGKKPLQTQLGSGTVPIASVIMAPENRVNVWVPLTAGDASNVAHACLSIVFIPTDPSPHAPPATPPNLPTLHSMMLHALPHPPAPSLPVTRLLTPQVTGVVAITVVKFLSSRRMAASTMAPFVSVVLGGAKHSAQSVTPQYISPTSTSLSLHFNSQTVLLPMRSVTPDRNETVEITLRDGTGGEGRVVAEGGVVVFGKVVAGGHALKMFVPMTRGGGEEKAGYLQLKMQFLPGQVPVLSEDFKYPLSAPTTPRHAAEPADAATLNVTVNGIRNLRVPGWPGKKDPYVTCELIVARDGRAGVGCGERRTELNTNADDVGCVEQTLR